MAVSSEKPCRYPGDISVSLAVWIKQETDEGRDAVEDNTVLIFLNAVDSRTAVKKEAETKAKSLGELEESAGDA